MNIAYPIHLFVVENTLSCSLPFTITINASPIFKILREMYETLHYPQAVTTHQLLLRSGVPGCLVKYENLPYLYFTVDIEKALYTLEGI